MTKHNHKPVNRPTAEVEAAAVEEAEAAPDLNHRHNQWISSLPEETQDEGRSLPEEDWLSSLPEEVHNNNLHRSNRTRTAAITTSTTIHNQDHQQLHDRDRRRRPGPIGRQRP